MNVEEQILVLQRDRLVERLQEMDRRLIGWKVQGTGAEDLNVLLREAAREIKRLRAEAPEGET